MRLVYDECQIYRLLKRRTVYVCHLLFANMHITSPLTGLLLWNERGRLHAKRRFLVIAPLNYAHRHAYASAFNRFTRFMCVPPVYHMQAFPWNSTWEVRVQCVCLPLTCQNVDCLVISSGLCYVFFKASAHKYINTLYKYMNVSNINISWILNMNADVNESSTPCNKCKNMFIIITVCLFSMNRRLIYLEALVWVRK